LTIADAITLRHLRGGEKDSVARLVDPSERTRKPNSTRVRIHRVVEFTNAAVRHGIGVLDSGSVRAFVASPMRADIPKIARASKNSTKFAMSEFSAAMSDSSVTESDVERIFARAPRGRN